MTMRAPYFLFVVGALLTTACSSTRSRGGGPGFDGAIDEDGSTRGERGSDGSIIVTGPDGSLGRPDATFNQPDATVSTPDASVVDNRTRMCGMYGPPLRSLWDEPRCEAATATCIANCDVDTQEQLEACAQSCVSSDGATPRTQDGLTIDCQFCLTYEAFRCYYESGCDVQIADFACCFEDKCTGLTGSAAQSCANSMCPVEGQAQNSCFQATRSSCSSATDSCFP